ncbi:MAG: O-antigen ligase family protein, partial [Candidatus Omnitrophica bacterium]|nr:O-antigen ligase family protein [Candidatus Omnitrophota bacterium]
LFMRLKIWDGTTNLILHNPLIGTGIGTFVWALPGYRPEGLNVRARFAHNDYLHMPAEMGFLALPLMILILLRVIGTGLGYYKKEGRIDELKLGCAIGILSLSLHGFIDFNFHIPANMILVCIYAGIVMGAKEC